MKTMVYVERTHPHGLALIAKAKAFSETVVALCEDEKDCSAAFGAGAHEAAVLGLTPDDCAQGNLTAQAIERLQPDSVLFPATIRGRFLSAWAAARLQTGLTADCTALGVTDGGLLLQSRPAFGGNLTADILCKTARPQMASVRPGVFPIPELLPGAGGPVQRLDLALPAARLTRLRFTPAQNTVSLQAAKVVVAGGKGVGSRRGFEKLARLAQLLGGAVGATRSAVDAGYAPYACQIGQTGQTVRPKLYIAFGVSGMIQHTVGMDGAKTVVAVNRDRTAPIFSHADYGVAGEWETVCDGMIAALERP